MNLEELRATLIEWLKELKTWYIPDHHWEDYVEIKTENYERVEAIFYTDDYVIRITGHPNDYMGGYISNRKMRAGEDWTRSGDLPDGKFCKETFDLIIKHAFAHGIVAKVKPSKPVADIPETTTIPNAEK